MMRAKTFLAVVLLSSGILVLWVWGGRSRRSGPAVSGAEPAHAGKRDSAAPAKKPPAVAATPRLSATTGKHVKPLAADHGCATPSAVSQESANRILLGLIDPNREIRRAALTEATQCDDRSLIPRLSELADSAQDPQEKAEIQAAIVFINLPSVTEALAERQAARVAAGQPDRPKALANRWNGKPFTQPAHPPAATDAL